jgi:hypothetical protein
VIEFRRNSNCLIAFLHHQTRDMISRVTSRVCSCLCVRCAWSSDCGSTMPHIAHSNPFEVSSRRQIPSCPPFFFQHLPLYRSFQLIQLLQLQQSFLLNSNLLPLFSQLVHSRRTRATESGVLLEAPKDTAPCATLLSGLLP